MSSEVREKSPPQKFFRPYMKCFVVKKWNIFIKNCYQIKQHNYLNAARQPFTTVTLNVVNIQCNKFIDVQIKLHGVFERLESGTKARLDELERKNV